MTDKDFIASYVAAHLCIWESRKETSINDDGSEVSKWIYDKLVADPKLIAKVAYDVADALMIERLVRSDSPSHALTELKKIIDALENNSQEKYIEYLHKLLRERRIDIAAELIAKLDNEDEG